jgi:glycosyltransferase involved in cell wall biosynthesis
LPMVLREHPDTQLVICGTGSLLPELQAVARSAGVERHVTFAGLVDNATVARYCAAADCFVLPSLLEALPTVAVEALASGTPVVSSDNPGGVELNEVFGADVRVVPRENPAALAAAISHRLQVPERTTPSTRMLIEQRFRTAAVARQFWDVYATARGGGA